MPNASIRRFCAVWHGPDLPLAPPEVGRTVAGYLHRQAELPPEGDSIIIVCPEADRWPWHTTSLRGSDAPLMALRAVTQRDLGQDGAVALRLPDGRGPSWGRLLGCDLASSSPRT